MKKITCLLLLFIASTLSYSQDTIAIDEVEIRATRNQVKLSEAARKLTVIYSNQIKESSVTNVAEVLEFVAGVDVRQRSQHGVQADLSIRGSSFEQVLVLLNGVKMTDPQTGHHALNIPVELLNIERIEVMKGAGARVFGPGAFAGSINIITKDPTKSSADLQLLSGEYGLTQLGVNASVVDSNFRTSLSYQTKSSDGYIRNTDFEQRNIFLDSRYNIDSLELTLNLGLNSKQFGAQNFYTERFPDQFEETNTQFAGLTAGFKVGKFKFIPRLYIRQHKDRFELFREDFDFYKRIALGGFANAEGDTIPWYTSHNYHKTNVYGAELSINFQTMFGTTNLGYDYRKEVVLSNNLGEPMSTPEKVVNEHPSAFYTKSAQRENTSLFFEQNYNYNNFFISAGALLNINSDFDSEIYPGADISYHVSKSSTVYLNVNKAFRLPTYTDLYYNLGGAMGSINLKPEESLTYEVGYKTNYKYFKNLNLAAFRRDGTNLIDWVRFDNTQETVATNLREVSIYGIETDVLIVPGPYFRVGEYLKSIGISYTYLTSDEKSDGFESNYVLDFLRHKLDASLNVKIVGSLELNAQLSYQERLGEYVNTRGEMVNFESVLLSNLKLSATKSSFTVFLQCSNIFDEKFVDIGNVVNPGRWFSAGISYRLD